MALLSVPAKFVITESLVGGSNFWWGLEPPHPLPPLATGLRTDFAVICTTQSAVMPQYVVCLSVRPSCLSPP